MIVKIRIKDILIIIVVFSAFYNGLAQDAFVSRFQTGAYIPGLIGVRDLVAPSGSGVMFANYSAMLFSNRFNDAKGNSISSIPNQNLQITDINIRAYNNTLDFMYVSPKLEFLNGIKYMAYIDIPYNTSSLQVASTEVLRVSETIKGGAAGFSDITVSPLTLSYSKDDFEITGGYTFVAPTGRYETGDDTNTGLGYWSHILQIGGYFYLNNKATAILVLPTYEFHGKLKDAGLKVGDRLALDYGISHYFTEKIEVTLQGGHVWQVGEDSGSAVYWNTTVKDRSSVVSAGVGYWFLADKLYGHLKWISSYGNRQFFQFNGVEAQLIFVP
ncbi:transporter [Tamlana sp. I1]|uniref:transporter n=1 Tax=Tamlana sp. I1 TaxID=2762061 RepID=UPI00188E0C85|nr:transporter [Tamlana sp. I1]